MKNDPLDDAEFAKFRAKEYRRKKILESFYDSLEEEGDESEQARKRRRRRPKQARA